MQAAFDNLGAQIEECKSNPSAAAKQRAFVALSYQQPGEIPDGLQQLAGAFKLAPGEIKKQFDSFVRETAAAREKTKPAPASIGKAKPSSSFESRSDSGNSRRLVNHYGEKLRFCHSLNRWLIWSGDRWQPDEDGAIFQYARAAARSIYEEASRIMDKTERRDHAAFALRSESERALKAMISLARTEPEIPIRREVLDVHPFKLNVLNGILDLTTGELLDHDPEYFFTKIIPWAYDSKEKSPRWEKFLAEITGRDKGLRDYLQQIAGYCLTASTREQVFFIFWGAGRNGKSTFIKILLELLGPWAAQTPAETFVMRKGQGSHNDLARLSDKRLVAAIETEEGGRLAESLIKTLSGNDRIAARRLYEENFEYEPGFKIILTTNCKPRIRETTLALWRRVRLVPFTWTIPEKKIDPDLIDKLKAEMPGILAWAVQGCFEWLNRGKLETPAAVADAVKEYQQAEDQIARFISECCEEGSEADSESAKKLFKAYQAWAGQNGEHFFSARRFGQRLQELGFINEHARTGNLYRKIRLIFSGDES